MTSSRVSHPSRADELVAKLRLQLIKRVAATLGLSEEALAVQLGAAIQDALRDHIRDLEKRLERAERLATVGQLSASVAHELRNPLSVIETSAFIIAERGKADERIARHTRRITEQVSIASGVVGDLLDAARGRPLVTGCVDVGTLARAAVAQVPSPPGIAIEIDIPSDLPGVAADERRMRQVLTNLITNAFEAMHGNGRVRISARASAPTVTLSVSDSGPGVSPEHASRIFEPLFTTKSEGTGLGLALSREIVRAHGGDITLAAGSIGARFDVTLPIAAVRDGDSSGAKP